MRHALAWHFLLPHTHTMFLCQWTVSAYGSYPLSFSPTQFGVVVTSLSGVVGVAEHGVFVVADLHFGLCYTTCTISYNLLGLHLASECGYPKYI